MLNRSGVTKETYAATKQILANVEHQVSVNCMIPKTIGVTVGDKKIVKAGTPIRINLMDLQTGASIANDTSQPMNAVLLHDVDVTTNSFANGTALIFGFVNVNRVDADVAEKINAVANAPGASTKITFVKV